MWDTQAVKKAVGPAFIFDGNKIGWYVIVLLHVIYDLFELTYDRSTAKFPNPLRITVDLDKENGRPPKMKKGQAQPDIHRVEIKHADRVRLASLHAYLNEQGQFDEEIIKGINFLDHLLREDPSKRLTNLRRSYFTPENDEGKQMSTIGGGVEAIKGVYQSLRLAEVRS